MSKSELKVCENLLLQRRSIPLGNDVSEELFIIQIKEGSQYLSTALRIKDMDDMHPRDACKIISSSLEFLSKAD